MSSVPAGGRWRGNGMRRRIALAGELVECRAAGKREPEQPRRLVERLARGVVARAPDDAHVRGDATCDELRVAARDEQREERIFRIGSASRYAAKMWPCRWLTA